VNPLSELLASALQMVVRQHQPEQNAEHIVYGSAEDDSLSFGFLAPNEGCRLSETPLDAGVCDAKAMPLGIAL
jgi:hypothetical protein